MGGAGRAVSVFATCSTDNRLFCTGQVQEPAALSGCITPTVRSVCQQLSVLFLA